MHHERALELCKCELALPTVSLPTNNNGNGVRRVVSVPVNMKVQWLIEGRVERADWERDLVVAPNELLADLHTHTAH